MTLYKGNKVIAGRGYIDNKANKNFDNITSDSLGNLVKLNQFDFFAQSARFMEAKLLNTECKGMSYMQMSLNGYSDVFSKRSFLIRPVCVRLLFNDMPVWWNNTGVVEFVPENYLDTGSSLEAGKDYYVFIKATSQTTFSYVCSLSSTPPENSRLIGGFHTICADTGTIANNIASGYVAGDIIPNSIWCLGFKPYGKTNGAVYHDIAGIWAHIYLQSGTGLNTTSAFGATITDTRYYGNHCLDMFKIGYQLPTDNEFTLIAFGSNEKTSIQGSADPVTTGGHVDTAGRRMISAYFCEDCCGVLWQWLNSEGGSGGTGWNTIGLDDDCSGSTYGAIYTLRGGGSLSAGACCGSGSRTGDCARSALRDGSSARGVSHNVVRNCDYVE